MKYLFLKILDHHFLKMRPVAEALSNRGHDVTWVVCDNAINIDPPMQSLLNVGKFIHVRDYATEDVVKQAADISRSFRFNLGNVNGISPFWAAYSARESGELIAMFRKLIEREAPNGVFVLHSNNFFAKIFAYVSQQEFGVPVYAFQEGMLRHADQVTMKKQSSAAEFVTKMFCWGTTARDAYLDAGVDENSLVVAGAPHMDKYRDADYAAHRRGVARSRWGVGETESVVVYFLPIANLYVGDIVKDIRGMAAQFSESGVRLVVRPHPMNNSIRAHLAKSGAIVDSNDDALDSICGADICVGQHSTVSVEANSLQKPFLFFSETGFIPEIPDKLRRFVVTSAREIVEWIRKEEWVSVQLESRILPGAAVPRIVKVVE